MNPLSPVEEGRCRVRILGQLRLQLLHLAHQGAVEQLVFQQLDELVHRESEHGAEHEGEQGGREQEAGA
jgi:hypothetical protein